MTEPTAVITPSPERRRRRRWPWVVLVVAVLLVGLGVAAELLARSIIPEVVRAQLVRALDLPDGQEIAVAIPGFHLGQLAQGRLDTVEIHAADLALGELRGSLDVTATGVPVRGGAIDGIRGTLGIRAEQFLALLTAADLPLDEVTMDAGIVTLSGEVRVLGFGVPLAVSAELSIRDGDITLRPYSFALGALHLDAQGLIQQLGRAGLGLTDAFPVCVADRLPRAVLLQRVLVDGDAARLDFSIDGAITVDPDLQAFGFCD